MSGQDGGRRQVGRVGVEATKAAERVPEALSVVVWLYSRWHHLLDPALLNGLGSVMCRWTSPSLLLTRWRPREPYTSVSGAVLARRCGRPCLSVQDRALRVFIGCSVASLRGGGSRVMGVGGVRDCLYTSECDRMYIDYCEALGRSSVWGSRSSSGGALGGFDRPGVQQGMIVNRIREHQP